MSEAPEKLVSVELTRLRVTVELMRHALQFYADAAHYQKRWVHRTRGTCTGDYHTAPVMDDGGAKARNALGKE